MTTKSDYQEALDAAGIEWKSTMTLDQLKALLPKTTSLTVGSSAVANEVNKQFASLIERKSKFDPTAPSWTSNALGRYSMALDMKQYTLQCCLTKNVDANGKPRATPAKLQVAIIDDAGNTAYAPASDFKTIPADMWDENGLCTKKITLAREEGKSVIVHGF